MGGFLVLWTCWQKDPLLQLVFPEEPLCYKNRVPIKYFENSCDLFPNMYASLGFERIDNDDGDL